MARQSISPSKTLISRFSKIMIKKFLEIKILGTTLLRGMMKPLQTNKAQERPAEWFLMLINLLRENWLFQNLWISTSSAWESVLQSRWIGRSRMPRSAKALVLMVEKRYSYFLSFSRRQSFHSHYAANYQNTTNYYSIIQTNYFPLFFHKILT